MKDYIFIFDLDGTLTIKKIFSIIKKIDKKKEIT
jgi:hypothetical protein